MNRSRKKVPGNPNRYNPSPSLLRSWYCKELFRKNPGNHRIFNQSLYYKNQIPHNQGPAVIYKT